MKWYVAIFSLVLLIVLSSFATAIPEIGHQFYGYAVDADATITAVVNDVSYTIDSDSDGYYGYDDIFFVGAASDEDAGGEEGDEITFYIDDTELGTYTFEVAGVTELNFDEYFGYEWSSSDSSSSSDDDSSDSKSSSSRSSSSSSSSDESSSGSSSSSIPCHHDWECTDWEDCEENGFQTRICYYTGSCANEDDQPDTRQECDYVPPIVVDEEETCYDGIKNQGERDVDCGGPCTACEEPVVEEPGSNWMYIILAILLILIIIGLIIAHKYRDGKLQIWWSNLKNKVLTKLGKKPKSTATATVQKTTQQRKYYPQQQRQQYTQYRQAPQTRYSKPAVPTRTNRIPLKQQ